MHSSRITALALSFTVAATALGVGCSKPSSSDAASATDAGGSRKKSLSPDWVPDLDPTALDTNAPLVQLVPESTAARAPASPTSSSSGAGAPAPGSPQSAAALAQAVGTVKLVSAGAEPRQKLRYKFHAGEGETLVTELHSNVNVEAKGMDEPDMGGPPIKMTTSIEPKTVSPEGDLRYDYHLTGIGLGDASGLPPQAIAAAKQELGALVGLGGYVVITSRGLTKDAQLQAPQAADPQIMQLLEQYQQTVRAIAPPLPDEPVGKGAKWTKTSTVQTAEARATQDETYTLTNLTGDSGTLDIVIAQNSPAQALGGMPPGMNARLESAKASGKGASAFDLNRIVPQTQQVDALSVTTYLAEQAGETQRMKVTLKVTVKLTGTKP